MNYARQQQNWLRSFPASAAVALFHVALIYALTNGLGRNIIERPPVTTIARVIEPDKVVPPPPPPLPPPAVIDPVQPAIHLPAVDIQRPAPPPSPARPAVTTGGVVAPGLPGRRAVAPDARFDAGSIIGGA